MPPPTQLLDAGVPMYESNRALVSFSRGLMQRGSGNSSRPCMGDYVQYALMTDDEKLSLATHGPGLLSLSETVIYKDDIPVPKGVLDPRMGPIEGGVVCSTCYKQLGSCPGHFGAIELKRAVLPSDHGPLEAELLALAKSVCIAYLDDGNGKTTYPNSECTIFCCGQPGKCTHNPKVSLSERNDTDDGRNPRRALRGNRAPITMSVEYTNSEVNVTKILSAEEVARWLKVVSIMANCTGETSFNEMQALVSKANILCPIDRLGCTKAQERAVNHYVANMGYVAAVVGRRQVMGLCTSVLLVVPPVHRPDNPQSLDYFSPSRLSPGGCTSAYLKVVILNQQLSTAIESVTAADEPKKAAMTKFSEKAYSALVRAIQVLLYDRKPEKADERVPDFMGLSDVLSGKNRGGGKLGIARSLMLGKRVTDNMRAVILGNSSMPYDCVGVPEDVLARMSVTVPLTRSDLPRLDEILDTGVTLQLVGRVCAADYQELGKKYWNLGKISPNEKTALCTLIKRMIAEGASSAFRVRRPMVENDVVMLNRQPTLQRQNVMSSRIRSLPKSSGNQCCFVINPELAKPYNADFDGDQMGIFATHDSIELVELAVLHSPAMLAASANGEMMFAPGQSTVLGLYAMSDLNGTCDSALPDHLMSKLLETFSVADLAKLDRTAIVPRCGHTVSSILKHALSMCVPSDFECEVDTEDYSIRGGVFVTRDTFRDAHFESTKAEVEWVMGQCNYASFAFDEEGVMQSAYVQGWDKLQTAGRGLPYYFPASIMNAGVPQDPVRVKLRVSNGKMLTVPRLTKKVLESLVQAVYNSHGGTAALATMACLQRVAHSAIHHMGERLHVTSGPGDLAAGMHASESIRKRFMATHQDNSGDMKARLEASCASLQDAAAFDDTVLRYGQHGEHLGLFVSAPNSDIVRLSSGGLRASTVSGAKGNVRTQLTATALGIGQISVNAMRAPDCESDGTCASAGFAGCDTYTSGFLDFRRFVQSQEMGCRGDMQGKKTVGDIGYIDRKQLLEHSAVVAAESGQVKLMGGDGHTRLVSPMYGGTGRDPARVREPLEYGSAVGSWAVEAMFADLSQEALDSKHGHGKDSLEARLMQLLEPASSGRPTKVTMHVGQNVDRRRELLDMCRGQTIGDAVESLKVFTMSTDSVQFSCSDPAARYEIEDEKPYMTLSAGSSIITMERVSQTPCRPTGVIIEIELVGADQAFDAVVTALISECAKKTGPICRVGERKEGSRTTIVLACVPKIINGAFEPKTIVGKILQLGLWSEKCLYLELCCLPLDLPYPVLSKLTSEFRANIGMSKEPGVLCALITHLKGMWRTQARKPAAGQLSGICIAAEDVEEEIKVTYTSSVKDTLNGLLKHTGDVYVDDPLEAQRYFGVEVGRMVLVTELRKIRPSSKLVHASLIADTVSLNGGIRGVNVSSSATVRTPLELLAFERVETAIIRAAIDRRTYSEDGVSVSAMFNRPAQIGTGLIAIGNKRSTMPVNRGIMGRVSGPSEHLKVRSESSLDEGFGRVASLVF